MIEAWSYLLGRIGRLIFDADHAQACAIDATHRLAAAVANVPNDLADAFAPILPARWVNARVTVIRTEYQRPLMAWLASSMLTADASKISCARAMPTRIIPRLSLGLFSPPDE